MLAFLLATSPVILSRVYHNAQLFDGVLADHMTSRSMIDAVLASFPCEKRRTLANEIRRCVLPALWLSVLPTTGNDLERIIMRRWMCIFRIQYDNRIKPVDVVSDLSWQDHPFVTQLRLWLENPDEKPIPTFPVPSELDPRPITHASDVNVGRIPDEFWTIQIPDFISHLSVTRGCNRNTFTP